MASIAKLRAPGYFVVVAHATEFPVNDVSHSYVVAARAHFEAFFIMAYIAGKAQAMKPVREDNWSHSSFFCLLVEHHVAILSMRRWRNQRKTNRHYGQPLFCRHFQSLYSSKHGWVIVFPYFAGESLPSDLRLTLWQKAHWVRGNATDPWQSPHCSPCSIMYMLSLFAPIWDLNNCSWQFSQASHSVCIRCGKRTMGMPPRRFINISKSRTCTLVSEGVMERRGLIAPRSKAFAHSTRLPDSCAGSSESPLPGSCNCLIAGPDGSCTPSFANGVQFFSDWPNGN